MDALESFDPATGEVGVLRMPPVVAAAIIAVKKQVRQLGHDSKNEHGRYDFVSVDKFYDRIGKLMAEAGLALLIDETMTNVRANEKSGSPWLFCEYSLMFVHESGAMSLALRRSIALPISGPQAFGAAQSYIEKQFLRQVFKIPTGERDADETAQDGIAPESRSAARQTQGSSGAATTAPRRQQAAPAPSEAKQEADKRWRELRDLIDAAVESRDLEGIDGCAAWTACLDKIAEAEEGNGSPAEAGRATAAQAMQGLRDRIERRRDRMAGDASGGY